MSAFALSQLCISRSDFTLSDIQGSSLVLSKFDAKLYQLAMKLRCLADDKLFILSAAANRYASELKCEEKGCVRLPL